MKSKFYFLSALLLMLMLVDASAASKQRKAESIRRTVQKYVQSAELISDIENVSVYSGRQNGYVVISKSENMPEVLGYGSGKLNAKEMPEGMKWLISYYNSIAEAVDAGKMNAPRAVRPPHTIEPLTKTTWDQDTPFWDMLPAVENEKTGKKDTVVVGCVATSMSQIMYYHKWPERGQGSVKWRCDVLGDMSADFSNSVYDWNNMLLTYGKEHKESKVATDAVALLCRDVAYACKSNFNTIPNGGTGSNFQDAAYALVHNFGYDKGIHLAIASHYSEEEWAALLYKELEAGRPIHYTGMTGGLTPRGHAFILDGINEEGLFHVNWGWRGNDDNYFLVTNLNSKNPGIGGGDVSVDNGYNFAQQAIFGIQKPVEGSAYRPYNIVTYCMPLNVAIDGNFTDVYCTTQNLGYDTFEGYYTCKPVNAETGEEIDIVLFKVDKVQTRTGSGIYGDTLGIQYSGVIPDGKYYFRIYTTDKDGYTTRCPMADSKQSMMFAVRGNKFYYIGDGIEIRNVKYSNIVADDYSISFDIDFDVVNTSNAAIEFPTVIVTVSSEEGGNPSKLVFPNGLQAGESIHFKKSLDLWGNNETLEVKIVDDYDNVYYMLPRMPIKDFVKTAGIAPVVVDAAADAPSYRVSGIPAKGNVKGIVISNGKKTIK